MGFLTVPQQRLLAAPTRRSTSLRSSAGLDNEARVERCWSRS